MKLAVIVATKNRSQLLTVRSLPSVVNQTLKPEYLIVCDDSSNEYRLKNKAVVQRTIIADCKVIYTQNHRSAGASGCWNSAVDTLLTYEDPCEVILAFLDDDDSWSPSYLQQCYGTMIDQQLDMVASGIRRIEGEPSIDFHGDAPNALDAPLFLIGNPGIQGSNLFLRLSTFLEAGGFDESLYSSTDRDLCIRLAEMKSVRYQAIPEILVYHYAEPDRVRLSKPNTKNKNLGLTTFWQKYHAQMSLEQRTAFSSRSKDLFDWSPPSNTNQRHHNFTTYKALIFSIESEINSELLNRLEEAHIHFRKSDLIGLDVVFFAEKDDGLQDSFCKTLRSLGIGCFSIERKELLRDYCNHISELRPGSKVWKIYNLTKLDINQHPDTVSYLTHSGATIISDKWNTEVKTTLVAAETIKLSILKQRIASAQHRVVHNFRSNKLRLLGSGSEAIVFTDERTVYKCIDYWKTRTPYAQFQFLRNHEGAWENIPGLYKLETVIRDGSWILITYTYEDSEPYSGGHENLIINLINGCTQAGIVCNNIHPKNLIHTDVEIKLIDYGSDIRPWNELGFEHMARRAYLSCYHSDRPDLKELMRESLHHTDIPELEGYEIFRSKLDYPIHLNAQQGCEILPAPQHEPFELVIGVISGDPLMIQPLLNSLRSLEAHSSISKMSALVLSNGCQQSDWLPFFDSQTSNHVDITLISEVQQKNDAVEGYFGSEIYARPKGKVGIALARTMLQRYLGSRLAESPGSIGWILDDDMRIDNRARDYISWLPVFREQGIDILLGAYEGSSPNPPLNGLRVQMMDLVHNLAWLSKLPEESILPDRSPENDVLRNKYPDYYYDLSRKHSAHLEQPLWLEPSYDYETVKEARNRLLSGALGILNGTPLTRGIVAQKCSNPLEEAKDSVNRGGCTFILNPESVQRTPNLILTLNGKEARRSDMIWSIINRNYWGMTIKAVSFPVQHIGRSSRMPSLNSVKVQSEIVGSALYAGLTEFLSTRPKHQLSFSSQETDLTYRLTMLHIEKRLRLLGQSVLRINGLAKTLAQSPYADTLEPLTTCVKQDFSLQAYEQIKNNVKKIDKQEVSCFLNRIIQSTHAYDEGFRDFLSKTEQLESSAGLKEKMSEFTI